MLWLPTSTPGPMLPSGVAGGSDFNFNVHVTPGGTFASDPTADVTWLKVEVPPLILKPVYPLTGALSASCF